MRPALVLATAAAVALATAPASGHPLGNFSISHYAGLEIGGAEVTVRYVVDMAEIPTFQETQETGLVAESGHPTVAPWAARTASTLARGLHLWIGDRRLALEVVSHEVIFPPGVGGLPTLKLGVVYRARLPADAAGPIELRYRDRNFAERAGWKEIVVRAREDVTLAASTAPAEDRSRELSNYPTDLLNSPPQDVEARVTFSRSAAAIAGGPPATATPLRPNAQASRTSSFARLVAQSEPGLGILAVALVTAAVLGAFHALEPGHGKTVVAAYLVGSRGTARHALILGLVVTASHTAGVYLLGAVTFYASRHIVPERLYPWLSLASGLTIAVLGLALFLRRLGGTGGHAPGHHHHHHHHEPHAHAHADGGLGHHEEDHVKGPVSLGALVALGVGGGIIPCPAAVVVLLTAVSMHRVGFGLVLIVAFSLGLAAVLVATGVLVVYAGRLMTRFREDGPWIRHWLPLTSSAVMTLLGLGIAVQAVTPWIPR